jgi:hypothetical protein
MASPFSWPVLVPYALRAPAPVNLGVRPREFNKASADIYVERIIFRIMDLQAKEILKRLAELGYFSHISHDSALFNRAVIEHMNVKPHLAFEALVKAGYVNADHGPHPHPVSYNDWWRLTLTKEGLAALLDNQT